MACSQCHKNVPTLHKAGSPYNGMCKSCITKIGKEQGKEALKNAASSFVSFFKK